MLGGRSDTLLLAVALGICHMDHKEGETWGVEPEGR